MRKILRAPSLPVRFTPEQLTRAVKKVIKRKTVIVGESQLFGELYLDDDGEAHFVCHTDGAMSFEQAREGLEKFITILQDQMERQQECPFHTGENHG